jgi:hypothetical protein
VNDSELDCSGRGGLDQLRNAGEFDRTELRELHPEVRDWYSELRQSHSNVRELQFKSGR